MLFMRMWVLVVTEFGYRNHFGASDFVADNEAVRRELGEQ